MMEDPRREVNKGRPIKWEAPVVSYEIWATTFVVSRFHDPSGTMTTGEPEGNTTTRKEEARKRKRVARKG